MVTAGKRSKHRLTILQNTINHDALNMRIQKPGKSADCLEVSYKKDAFKKYDLSRSFFSKKVADLQPATSLKKKFLCRCFPGNFAKI